MFIYVYGDDELRKINEETRQLILKSAREILATEGVEKLNMRRVAVSCDIGLGTIYNYYKSKEEIIKEVVHNQYYSIFERLKLDISKENDTYGKLKRVFEAMRSFNIELQSISINRIFSLLSKANEDDKEKMQREGNEKRQELKEIFSEILKENDDFYIESIMMLFAMHASNINVKYEELENFVKEIIEARKCKMGGLGLC